MIVNKLLYRISLNKAKSWIMVFNCNLNAFSNLTSIIYLYNENMNLEMTIKKLGSAYKFRVSRATGNEHIFLFGLSKFRQISDRLIRGVTIHRIINTVRYFCSVPCSIQNSKFRFGSN